MWRCQRCDARDTDCSTTRKPSSGAPTRNSSGDGGRQPGAEGDQPGDAERADRPAELAHAERGDVERRSGCGPGGSRGPRCTPKRRAEPLAEPACEGPDDVAERRDRQQPRCGAGRPCRRGVRPQPLGQRTAGEPALRRQHEGGADPEHEAGEHDRPRPCRSPREHPLLLGQPHDARRPRPSRARPCPMPATTASCPMGVAYALRPLPIDMPARAMPSGTMSTKRRAKRTPACLARASLRPWTSWTRSSASAARRRSRSVPPSSWATSSVSHVDVGGGVGEPVLEHAEGAGEVGGGEPLAVRGREGRPQLGRAAPADLEQGLGDRATERRRCGCGSPRSSAATPPAPGLAGSDGACGTTPTGKLAANARQHRGPAAAPPNTANPSAAPTTDSAAITATNSAGTHVVEPGLGEPLGEAAASGAVVVPAGVPRRGRSSPWTSAV